MIFTSVVVAFLVALAQANEGVTEEAKDSNLLPDLDGADFPQESPLAQLDTRGRSDIDIEEDEPQQPSGGYFYPKPAIAFNLPEFKTLDAQIPLDGYASYVVEDTQGRVRRSLKPRPPKYQISKPKPYPPLRPPRYPAPHIPSHHRPSHNFPSQHFPTQSFPSQGIRPLPALY